MSVLVLDDVEVTRVVHETTGWVLVVDEPADAVVTEETVAGDFLLIESTPSVTVVSSPQDFLLIDAPAPTPEVLSSDGVADFIVIQAGGPPGPQGPAGPVAGRYTHDQITPAAEWTVQHNLGTYPTVVLFLDTAPDEQVYTDLSYASDDLLYISFPSPESGRAYLS